MRRPTSTYQWQDVKKKKSFVPPSEITAPQVEGSGRAVGIRQNANSVGSNIGTKSAGRYLRNISDVGVRIIRSKIVQGHKIQLIEPLLQQELHL